MLGEVCHGPIRPRSGLLYERIYFPPEVVSNSIRPDFFNPDLFPILAPSILPGLLSAESRRELYQTQERIFKRFGFYPEFELYTSYLPVLGCERDWLPWDLFTSIKYQGKRILGPMLVSFSHKVMGDPELNRETKITFLLHTLGQMVFDWGLIMFFTPKLKRGSFTQEAFATYFDYKAHDITIDGNQSTIHFIKGYKISDEEFESLTQDECLREAVLEIVIDWSKNFRREMASRASMGNDRSSIVDELLRLMR